MFRNYLKIALRNLVKHKAYTFINVLGLSIGIAACLLMLLFVQHELSYDAFHEKADRIFRVNDRWSSGEIEEELAVVPFPVGPTLKLEYPERIEAVTRLYRPASWGGTVTVDYQDQSLIEDGIVFADPSFFDLFDFEVTQGSETALQSPNGVMLTESVARRYFGDDNPIGQRLRLNNDDLDLEVGAVVRDIPDNSHIQFDFLVSSEALVNWWNNPATYRDNWTWTACWTYFLLSDAEVAGTLQKELPGFVDRHFPGSVKDDTYLHLQALTDIHLHPQAFFELSPGGNIIYVYIFSAIAALILLIACINFMNLATARSAGRAREVGMRKVLGAYRSNLIRQFLGETVLMSLLALLLAIALVELALPLFNSLTGKALDIHYFENGYIILALLGIGLLVGMIAGSYPALYLSGFRPVAVLKGARSKGVRANRSEATLRKGLVVSQFVISLVLLICITTIYNQLNYLRSKDLGFNQEQVIQIDRFGLNSQQYLSLKHELEAHKDVLSVSSLSGSVPGRADGVANAFVTDGMSPDNPLWLSVMWGSYDFEKVLGLELLTGRSFSTEFRTDSSEAYIINEATATRLGWDLEEALGKRLHRLDAQGQVGRTGTIIGVVNNFHYQSLHEALKPLVIPFGAWDFVVRIGPNNIPETISYIQEIWQTRVPDRPLNYSFLDDNIEQLYRKEQKLGQIIQYFTLLAIFIACLGLFGLASFTTQSRTKEIGVRKVLGASISGLIILVSKEFTRLVFIAFVIAAPIAWYAMNRWLENFAYRVEMGLWVFALAGSLAFLIAWLTVSWQAIRAALANPVESLRYE